MSWQRRSWRAAPAMLLTALMLGAVPGPASLAAREAACRVSNVTQGTDGTSFRRTVARAHDGDRLRIRGVCTSNGVVIDKDLRIRGVGAGATLQSRRHGRRVLRVTEGASVVLRDLAIEGGTTEPAPFPHPRPRGVGILNEGRLELRRVIIQGNGGNTSSGLAIWNGGTLTLRRTTVRDNGDYNFSDGAIVNHGTLLIRRSLVLDNDQAGIVNHGQARLVDSLVSGHRNRDHAQGVTNHGEMTILRSSIRRNMAMGLDVSGIGNSGTMRLIDSVVSDNRDGVGIGNTGTLTITGSVIRHNRNDWYGGGIGNSGTMRLIDSVIRDNIAGSGGGGVWNWSDAQMRIRRSRLLRNQSRSRGGGLGNLGTLTLVDTVIRDNEARGTGGGIYNGGVDGEPIGTLVMDAGTSVHHNSPDDCVGTAAC